jgi:septum site-determining protein MinC
MSKRLCELKSGQFQLMRLAIYQANWADVQSFVADQVASAPEFFEQAAVAIDVSAIESAITVDSLEDLLMRLRYAGVQPIALVANTDDPIAEHARALKLGVVAPTKKANDDSKAAPVAIANEIERPVALAAKTDVTVKADSSSATRGRTDDEPTRKPASKREMPVEAVSTAPLPSAIGPQLYDGPVRSGQQLYARGRDLIITGSVGAGAEVMADGHVHVYGRLQGKVIAGANGDRNARVFAQVFGAELVSIAGVYRVLESLPSDVRGRAVQIFLDGDKMKIESLS